MTTPADCVRAAIAKGWAAPEPRPARPPRYRDAKQRAWFAARNQARLAAGLTTAGTPRKRYLRPRAASPAQRRERRLQTARLWRLNRKIQK